MSRTITMRYLHPLDNNWQDVMLWLDENVGPIKTWGIPMKAHGWEMWDVESGDVKTNPFYKQTKIRFYKEEDAVLFAMRWVV